jgi:hypothetical protein
MYGRIDNMYVCSKDGSRHWFGLDHSLGTTAQSLNFIFEKRICIMTNFKKIIPAVALVVALSPFAASATSGAAHTTGYLNSTTISSQVAANSKGRPAEFNTNTNQVAANSKGRPAEFNTNTNQVAVNSKGRPAEFNTNTNQVAANSKGRPAEFNTATNNQVADNSKGRPAEFAPSAPETPIG